jgi:hypothetical protein
MSNALTTLKYNSLIIESLETNKKIDLTNSLIFCDYFEDILSPCVMMTVQVASTYSIYNGLPIRGGEKVELDIETLSGNFKLVGDYAMYVYKVSGIVSDGAKEYFTLHLCSREGLTNETARVQKKYAKKPINDHVTDILKDVLKTKKFKSSNIEKTSNSYSFIGTLKKPFHILTWLGPKGVPTTSSSGNSGKIAKGVAGFVFYENKDGFHFRSIDTLVSATQSQNASTSKESIPKYNYNPGITESGNLNNNFNIINYNFEKNIDLMKSLRVGMYSNITYFYDLYKNKLDGITYSLNSEVKSKLGGSNKLAYPKDFGNRPSRILFRSADTGTLDTEGIKEDSGRDNTDMAKSFSRYNLLFTQALNMIVPMNINLKAGNIIYAQFQQIDASQSGEVDPEQSGNYLIKEVRHHFEGGQMISSLKLVRDSYGLYGAKQ